MALINKIRERSGIAVVVIAVALILFIVGGDIFLGNNGSGGLFSSNKNAIGEIAGTTIDYNEFVAKVENVRASAGRALNDQDMQQVRSQVWEEFIFDNAYKKEFEKLGLKVTPDELREMVQGTKNLHPSIRQYFSNPQTQQYDRNQHMEFINAAAANQLPAAQKTQWDQIKQSVIKQRLLEKYNALLTASSFVTSAEGKKEYEAQTTRADAKYLFVTYNSITDSTIKVSDSQLSDYLSKHKNEYQGFDSRSFNYVVLNVAPTKEDSSALYSEIKNQARGLASAVDPQAYATQNSDGRFTYKRASSEVSATLKAALASAIPGAVIGPFKEENAYLIHKYDGIENDSLYTVRASHILISAQKDAPDSVKASARTRANDILNQIKAGADFATMARTNGSDGTAQQGGDLGYFKNNGGMVKPFETAIFGFSGAGLMPNLVETDFGYHIVKVTEAKTNTIYKLATISKELSASDGTRNAIFQKAETLRSSCDNSEEFEAAIKKDKSLVLLKAENVRPEAQSFNTIQNGRGVVSWAFGDEGKVGKVSNTVFELDNSYIIASITGSTEKDSPKASDFKDELTRKVRNEVKAQQILTKLGTPAGALEDIAKKYGAGAVVESVSGINLANGILTSPGVDLVAIGKVFGQAAGKRTKPFIGENGVFVVETTAQTPAPNIADYTQFKTQVSQRNGGFMASQLANQALRESANIKDNRTKFF